MCLWLIYTSWVPLYVVFTWMFLYFLRNTYLRTLDFLSFNFFSFKQKGSQKTWGSSDLLALLTSQPPFSALSIALQQHSMTYVITARTTANTRGPTWKKLFLWKKTTFFSDIVFFQPIQSVGNMKVMCWFMWRIRFTLSLMLTRYVVEDHVLMTFTDLTPSILTRIRSVCWFFPSPLPVFFLLFVLL